jgi:DNA-binding PadR family transcriptional regulator
MFHQSCHGARDERLFSGRHRRNRGWGGPFGPGIGGRGGFPFGRFVGDGELRLIVLALMEKGPRHGYDLIKALEERSGGFYSPSPGVIYPTLTFLEEAGYASSNPEGSKKVYEITDSGRAYLDENREAAEAILARIEWIGKRLAQARSWFDRGEGEGRGDRDIPDVAPELNEARRALKAALAAKLDASAEEQRRVADILFRAAGDIAGRDAKKGPDSIDL